MIVKSELYSKLIKYGIIIVPYVFLAFVIFKTQEESKVQTEIINKKLIQVTQQNAELIEQVTRKSKENEILISKLKSKETELKQKDLHLSRTITEEKFDKQTGKLTERKQISLEKRESTKEESSKNKTQENLNSKHSENEETKLSKKQENSNSNLSEEIKTDISYKRKKFGVNVGVISSIDKIGPIVSYTVIPITSETSVDVAAALLNKPVVGVQVSASVVDSVGVGVGVFIEPENILTPKIIPGVSVQYRF